MLVRQWVLLVSALLWLAGCAGLPQKDPLQVTVAGIESIPGEGLELRMLVRLRVQNPNDAPFDFDGIAVRLDVQGKTFATGVAAETGAWLRLVVIGLTLGTLIGGMRWLLGFGGGGPVGLLLGAGFGGAVEGLALGLVTAGAFRFMPPR